MKPSSNQTLASMVVHANEEIGRVHPYLFGQFLEHFPGQIYGGVFDEASPYSDRKGFRTDVIQALKGLEVPLIRWPGGCYASGYHWEWGAGPATERKARQSPCWNFHDSHRFGTTEFVELCRRIGAEPLICVGVGPKERHPTPDEAAAWVRYCNADVGPEAALRERAGYSEPLNVTLWGLGNEVFAGIYDEPDDYGRDLLQLARAMRQADPLIRFVIVGAERHWLEDWNSILLADDEVVRLADWISWHDYLHTGMCEGRPDNSGLRQPYERVMEHLQEVEETVEMLCGLNGEASARAGKQGILELAVDEWNELGWEMAPNIPKNDLPETYSLAHALYTAGFLNVLIRHADRVTMANYSPTVNTRGLIFSGSQGVVLRTTYHVYGLFRACAGGTAVRTVVKCLPLVNSSAPALDAVAVISEKGETMIVVVNRHPSDSIRCRIHVEGMSAIEGTATTLTGDSLASFNDYDHPADVAPGEGRPQDGKNPSDYTFEPRSVTVLSTRPH